MEHLSGPERALQLPLRRYTFLYYLWLRPHQGLAGATPADVLLGPKDSPPVVPPPRGKPGEQPQVSLGLEIRHLDPEKRLPYLLSKAE